MTTSDATKDRIVLKYLVNVAISEIIASEGVGETTIYNILNDFYSQFGKGSRRVKLLMEAMRRSNLSVKHHAVAVRLLYILIKFVAADEEELPNVTKLEKATDLLERWCNMCAAGLIDPTEALRITEDIQALCKSLKVSPNDLSERVKSMANECKSLTETIKSLQQREKDANMRAAEAEREMLQIEHDRDKMLQDFDTTTKELDDYRDVMREIGMSVSKPKQYFPSLVSFIQDMKAKGYDAGWFIPKLREIKQMEADNARLVENWKNHGTVDQRLMKMYSDKWRAMGQDDSVLSLLHAAGISKEQATSFIESIMEAARLRGDKPEELLKVVTEAIKTTTGPEKVEIARAEEAEQLTGGRTAGVFTEITDHRAVSAASTGEKTITSTEEPAETAENCKVLARCDALTTNLSGSIALDYGHCEIERQSLKTKGEVTAAASPTMKNGNATGSAVAPNESPYAGSEQKVSIVNGEASTLGKNKTGVSGYLIEGGGNAIC